MSHPRPPFPVPQNICGAITWMMIMMVINCMIINCNFTTIITDMISYYNDYYIHKHANFSLPLSLFDPKLICIFYGCTATVQWVQFMSPVCLCMWMV